MSILVTFGGLTEHFSRKKWSINLSWSILVANQKLINAWISDWHKPVQKASRQKGSNEKNMDFKMQFHCMIQYEGKTKALKESITS